MSDLRTALEAARDLLLVEGDPPSIVNIEDEEPNRVAQVYEQISRALAAPPSEPILWQERMDGPGNPWRDIPKFRYEAWINNPHPDVEVRALAVVCSSSDLAKGA